ncbi:ATP-dependent Clp protease adapter ClpS [Phragmitibacter flavus]|uniref:ATP-dependent Clp protease adapter protein ClpS n=1 Tax=Phragmitibacter flavus TaxID=2576071 RepID=A0A5R8KIS9_9BACT|nr:ATP-dependent Clp protease adapter ClpS [Phragmitibacter flavus]TLD72214.1 ATP-dependent Clp protease adapter ClpS [Phragmitibacter flavus]
MPSTTATPELETDTEVTFDEPWNVLIHNDPVNLMSYVAHVIRKIFGYNAKQAEKLMLEVHQEGKSMVWSGSRERAELYVKELHGHQLLATMEKAGG